ncbi:MAG: hypothetical protein QXU32_13220 [Nitrososphaerales archaeon]
MAVGLSANTANGWLDALCRNVSFAAAAFWVRLHSGDPGADGTANNFGDGTRQQASFAAASGGSISTNAALTWSNLSAGGTISHLSFWTASSAGTFLGSAQLTNAKTVDAGDTFTIPSGSGTISVSPLAA